MGFSEMSSFSRINAWTNYGYHDENYHQGGKSFSRPFMAGRSVIYFGQRVISGVLKYQIVIWLSVS